MALMVWRDEFSVGNEKLDSQHRHLVELINELKGDTDLGIVLAGLRAYASEHFREEEAQMEAAGYPELERHRYYHRAFQGWLDDVTATYRAGGDAAAMRQDLHSYLNVWLANHMLVYDKAFEPWLKKDSAELVD